MPLGNPIRKQNESRMVSVLATDGQTVFTVQGGYIINHISVFRNGVRLSPADDFTAGDGSTVTLNNATNVNDRIDFHIFDRFTVQNAIIGAASTQTINGDLVLNGKLFSQLDVPSISLTGIITATELDLNGKGDISGDLNVAGVVTATSFSGSGANLTGIDATTIKDGDGTVRVQGNTSGIVVTGVSTYSGNLDINADVDVSGTSTINGLVSIATSIVHTGDTNTSIGFSAADAIDLRTGGIERLRIQSDKVQFSIDAKPDNHNVRDLGTSENRWRSLYLGTDLNVAGVSTFANTVISGVSTFTADSIFTGDNYNVQWNKSHDRFEFLDNSKATFGSGQDLTIYHSGSHSFMQHNGAGHLIIGGVPNGTNVDIMKSGYSEYLARFKPDSSVDLYWDGNVRFQTTPSGVDITNTLNVAGVSTFATNANFVGNTSGRDMLWNASQNALELRGYVQLQLDDQASIRFGTDEDLIMYHSGAHGYINNKVGTFYQQNNGTNIYQINSDGLSFLTTGAIKLPVGTTGERPSGVDGELRFNSTLSQTEEYRDSGWFSVSNKSVVTGGTITTSGRYTIHTFTSSGTLTVSGATKSGVDYIIVAGG